MLLKVMTVKHVLFVTIGYLIMSLNFKILAVIVVII